MDTNNTNGTDAQDVNTPVKEDVVTTPVENTDSVPATEEAVVAEAAPATEEAVVADEAAPAAE